MKTATKLLKTRSLWLRAIAVGAVIAVGLAGVPAFAKEPMTISGAWLREDVKITAIINGNEKGYYYFSPGGVDGTAVGIAVTPDVLGGQQVVPFTGTWDFEEKDGKQLFCVYKLRLYVSGKWLGGASATPSQGIYRFYTEGGKQKMELQFISKGQLTGDKEIWTKIGTKVSDLPELGVLAYEGNTGGKFWEVQGIAVK
jgi:hypothetical protein